MNQHEDVFTDVSTEMLERFPALANAAPLAEVPFPGFGNIVQIGGAADFLAWLSDHWRTQAAQVANGTWRLRNPASSPDGLIGPFKTRGDCLAPLIDDKVLRWIDPTEPASHGDIVTVVADREMLAPHMRRGFEEQPGFAEMYSMPLGDVLVKQLVHLNGAPYLTYRRGGFNIGNNRILGVCRYVTTLDGEPLYGSGEAA